MRRNSFLSHVLSIIALPFVAMILLPAYLHLYVNNMCCEIFHFVPDMILYFPGALLLITGLFLFAACIRLFATRGKGTLAPWAPPVALVISGPYKYVRNPMISAVNMILLGLSFVLHDENILFWQVFFFAFNTVYFVVKEEPDLEKRFGKEYVIYKKNVPRWIPRFKAWE